MTSHRGSFLNKMSTVHGWYFLSHARDVSLSPTWFQFFSVYKFADVKRKKGKIISYKEIKNE